MSSWFNLELDTTSPKIEVYTPQYTSIDIITDIYVKSNKKLMDFQEVYIIDSKSNRHDLSLLINDNTANGKVILNNCSLGLATLYLRFKDEVGNLTELITKTINIYNGNILNLNSKIIFQDIELNTYNQELSLIFINNSIELTSCNREISMSNKNQDCTLESEIIG